MLAETAIAEIARKATSRIELWAELINAKDARVVLEVGVWKGDFAEAILSRCPGVTTYYMLDPWRRLTGWNKPFNKADTEFENIYRMAVRKTDFAKDRRIVLRGTTTEVIHEIADGSVDLAYIDGDHTLRGILIDLVAAYPKVRDGGIIGGDDFSPTIWQHDARYEPTLVAPVATHFAEAVNNPITVLPFQQYAIEKAPGFAVSGAPDFPLELRPHIGMPAKEVARRALRKVRSVPGIRRLVRAGSS